MGRNPSPRPLPSPCSTPPCHAAQPAHPPSAAGGALSESGRVGWSATVRTVRRGNNAAAIARRDEARRRDPVASWAGAIPVPPGPLPIHMGSEAINYLRRHAPGPNRPTAASPRWSCVMHPDVTRHGWSPSSQTCHFSSLWTSRSRGQEMKVTRHRKLQQKNEIKKIQFVGLGANHSGGVAGGALL